MRLCVLCALRTGTHWHVFMCVNPLVWCGCQGADLVTPDAVAKCLIAGMKTGSFEVSVGPIGHILTSLTSGFNPVTAVDVLANVCLAWLAHIIAGVVKVSQYGIVASHWAKKRQH